MAHGLHRLPARGSGFAVRTEKIKVKIQGTQSSREFRKCARSRLNFSAEGNFGPPASHQTASPRRIPTRNDQTDKTYTFVNCPKNLEVNSVYRSWKKVLNVCLPEWKFCSLEVGTFESCACEMIQRKRYSFINSF